VLVLQAVVVVKVAVIHERRALQNHVKDRGVARARAREGARLVVGLDNPVQAVARERRERKLAILAVKDGVVHLLIRLDLEQVLADDVVRRLGRDQQAVQAVDAYHARHGVDAERGVVQVRRAVGAVDKAWGKLVHEQAVARAQPAAEAREELQGCDTVIWDGDVRLLVVVVAVAQLRHLDGGGGADVAPARGRQGARHAHRIASRRALHARERVAGRAHGADGATATAAANAASAAAGVRVEERLHRGTVCFANSARRADYFDEHMCPQTGPC